MPGSAQIPPAPEVPVDTFAWRRACREALCAQLSADAYGDGPLSKQGFARFTVPEPASGRKPILSAFGYVEDGVAYISFRGTVPSILKNWLSDFHAMPTGKPRRHRGFNNCWKRLRPQVRAWLAAQKPRELVLTGHSLGGAIAQLAALELAAEWPIRAVVCFGAPLVGWRAFAAAYDATPIHGRPDATLGAITTTYAFKSDAVRFLLHLIRCKRNGEQTVIDENGRVSDAFHPWYSDAPSAGLVPLAWFNSAYEAIAGDQPSIPEFEGLYTGGRGIGLASPSPLVIYNGRVDWRHIAATARPVVRPFMAVLSPWIGAALAGVVATCTLITSYLSVKFIGRDIAYHSMENQYANAMANRVQHSVPDAYQERGEALLTAKDPQRALAYLDTALAGYLREGQAIGLAGSSLVQHAWQPRLSRAAARIALGDYTQAIADLTALIDSYPFTRLEIPVTASAGFAPTPQVLALEQRATAREHNRQFQEAMDDYAALLSASPAAMSTDDYAHLGEAARRHAGVGAKARPLQILFGYKKREVTAESQRLYELSFNPVGDGLAKLFESAHYHRALCAFALKNYPLAILEATAALTLNDRDAAVYHVRAVAYVRSKQTGEAFLDLDKSIELEPGIAEYWFARAYIRLSLGAHWEKENGNTFLSMHLTRQDFEAIESDFVKTLELDPSHQNAQQWLDRVRQGMRSLGL